MRKVYFIGDTHFDHAKLLNFPERGVRFKSVEEMNERIISNWNSVVEEGDKVFLCGDVALSTTPESLDGILGQLKGEKVLVMGNHDNAPSKIEVYNKHFTALVGAVEYKDAIVTHIPVHPSQLEYRWKYNIHGHTHHHCVMTTLPGTKITDVIDNKYLCCSCEQVWFRPVTYEELLSQRKVIL